MKSSLMRTILILFLFTLTVIIIYSQDVLNLREVSGGEDDSSFIAPHRQPPIVPIEVLEQEEVENSPAAAQSTLMSIDDEKQKSEDQTQATASSIPQQQQQQQLMTYDQVINEKLEDKLERIAYRGDGYKQVIITTCSFAFRNFLYNWLCSIQNLPNGNDLMSQILVYTVDEELARDIIETRKLTSNVYLEKMQEGSLGPLDYETGPYRTLIMHRTNFIKKVLVDLNYRILLADNDAVWLQSPLPHLTNTYKDFDMLAQNDGNERNPITCGGFLYLNNTEKMKSVWSNVAEQYASLIINKVRSNDNEQFMLQRMSYRYSIKLLPHENYPSGIVYFSKANPLKEMPNVHVVHNNFVVGAQKKLERFKRFPGVLWQIDDEMNCKARTS